MDNHYITNMLCKLKWLFEKIDHKLKVFFPHLHDTLVMVNRSQPLLNGMLGLFPCGFLNYNYSCAAHIDSNDYKHGVAAIITFGDYTGGQLVLHDWRAVVQSKPGTLVFLKAHEVIHSVAPYTGIRNSLVLYLPNSMIGGQY